MGSPVKGKYKFKPGRKVEIAKPNGEVRTLIISSPREKIVQQAIKQIFEPYYEKTFSEFSFGFRPLFPPL